MRFLLLSALLMALAKPAVAQDDAKGKSDVADVFERGCGDDRGIDRCAPAEHRRMRQLYKLADPTELLQQRVSVRRAMFVDGYGNDVVAVSFIRRPGSSPAVEVNAPLRDGYAARQPLVANLDAATWDAVIADSRFFDQKLAREVATANGDTSADVRICLHAWFVVAEAVDAPRVDPNTLAGTGSIDSEVDPSLPVDAPIEPGSIRQDSESACSDGLAMAYAFDLATKALAALPECRTLDGNSFRNKPELLRQCYYLEGDRLVAGEAQNTIQKLDRLLRTKNKQELEWLFVGFGSKRAKIFEAAIENGHPVFSFTTGLDADHAKTTGQVIYFNSEGEPTETADLSLNLIRQVSSFVIDTFAVTNRKPLKAQR